MLGATKIEDVLARRAHDFVDFGCSTGGSMVFATRLLKGGPGFGIDIAPEKVAKARAAGHEAYVADARALLNAPNAVRFAVLSHFLEHLPTIKDAIACIRSAVTVARDFVFIRQPWFDADGYLLSNGLKLYWSDWDGHTNTMSTLEMYRAIRSADRVAEFAIYGHEPIEDSTSTDIHPLSSPVNSHRWDEAAAGPKPHVTFSQPVYREMVAVIVKAGSQADIEQIARQVTQQEPLVHIKN